MYIMRKRPPVRKTRRKTQKRWTMAEARKRLPELVQAASEAPQVLYRRDEIVGAIVGPHELARLTIGQRERGEMRSIGAAFAELRRINVASSEDDFDLVAPPRMPRPDPFADEDDVPR